ncbi:MAG: DEAD/DEAH box helicase [Salinivirgaceae bacterium]|nr:DEAD/DEAH box helicase [Salinivirgaceae bacterium]
MSAITLNKPGTLVNYRSRDWMVLPSEDPDLMRIKPLGGSEEEETAVFLPLIMPGEEIKSAHFAEPTVDQLGAFNTAKLLFDASRLSFRNASGPFRCMGKLSFRPRAYQLVPLVMALKQDVVRLMIADDVGIGKTIEALVILKELMERGDIKRFAVVCPPHLCEQWAQELKDKLDIEAEIIRSSTAAKLDRTIPDDNSIFHHVHFQVISIDYIKADKRRGIFINDCPEFLIVDEAHSCALPEGASSKSAQQRHSLLYDLAQNEKRHIVFLTATPHSGKDSEFLSLMGLLKPSFKTLNLDAIEDKQKRKLAEHFIQRKRERIKYWLDEHTLFPNRDSKEIGYQLTPEYNLFYQSVLRFARVISSKTSDNKQTQMLRSWAAIALIRGVMSSPAMALEMLQNRKSKLLEEGMEESIPTEKEILFGNLQSSDDTPRKDLMDALPLEAAELDEIEALTKEAELLQQLKQDQKVKSTLNLINQWIDEGHYPIIFCQYIPTAKYVAAFLKEALPKKVRVEAVTSELADEQRRELIDGMETSDKRVLVATDCLSEGINLQNLFTAVLHYDLPWNPNRIEQREGRVDRFGQDAPEVKTCMLYGQDNPMDEFVMEVLIRKIKEIQKTTGVTISIGEDSENLMTKAAQKILFDNQGKEATQMQLFAGDQVKNELEQARKKGEKLRSIFAHESIKPETIKKDLQAVDEAIGDVETVEHFVMQSLEFLGASFTKEDQGYRIQINNLPAHLKNHFSSLDVVKISFESPTPKGYRYIGRNHLFVEQICHFMLALAFDGHEKYPSLARVSEIQTDAVETRTTLVMFRVRNVIKEVNSKREVISEEMYLWGYRGMGDDLQSIDYTEGKQLLMNASSLIQLPEERQKADLTREMEHFTQLKPQFIEVATKRAENLVEAHGRFKELVGGRRYEKATPILPPDVMGVYILMPKPKAL